MSARDDLAGRLRPLTSFHTQVIREGRHTKVSVDFTAIADALVGEGWSRPRVVTTAAELDALPDGAVLKHVGDLDAPDPAGLVVEAWITAFGRRWALSGSGALRRTSQMVGGAWLVVWSPPAETDGTKR